MSAEAARADAWALTRAISPRDRVRVASVDAAGTVLNQYAGSRRLTAEPPATPWAVHLADPDGYRLIAFDLDAKHGAGQPARDAATITALLTGLGIAHVICRSGPADGRHVWLACTSPVDPALVATLGRFLAARCPSLDTAPLNNAATGCVRPPGSPHRDGGTATVLTGNLDTLRTPSTTPDQLAALVQQVAAQITGTEPGPAAAAGIRTDPAGHPYLPGLRRPLPRASAVALQQPVGDGDASVQLWKVLLGAAASHWHLADLAELAATAPGLEHLRSRRSTRGGQRTPRSRFDAAQTLTRQWRYAVRYAVANPRSTGDDDTFDTRAGTLTDTVRALQQRADAAPGRWQHGGGPADRRVLDTLHTLALLAVTATVEADIRRLALAAGIGRETARTALARLTADGWISQARPASGVHGAVWTIDPHNVLHRDTELARSQAATRPAGAGAADRTLLLEYFQDRLTAAAHDVFSQNHALPHRRGNSYARLSPITPRHPADAVELDDLDDLRQYGLAIHTPNGWIRTAATMRDGLARRFGVHGRLEQRRGRYTAEREVWSWWQAEHDWMNTPRADRERRRSTSQTPLWQTAADARYPRHPRRTDGRADYAAARAAHAAGALHPHELAA